MRKRTLIILAGVLTFSFYTAIALWSGGQAATLPVDFVRDIAPLFQANCSPCHFGDKARGDLRLDNKALTLKLVAPGKSMESRIIQRLLGANGEKQMPLGRAPLATSQIELIKRWIDEGASWPETVSANSGIKTHWAYIPPVRPTLPEVRNQNWVRNPIDRFILARLEREKLAPSPEADKATLLRRLSLDLIGLPPTADELDAFLKDVSPNAYQKQVDRLLASEHYGERWGRQWLDAARYADSDGFEKDKPRFVWFYRDYIVNSLNHDKPYDQFVIEQIAGDLLPNASQDQLVATGFLRNSMINEEGGVDPEQFRMEAMFDRMDAIGKSVLGFTVNCAQCHNHKYDPLTQEEYYRMFAYLNNSNEGASVVFTPEQQMSKANILSRTAELEARLKEKSPDWEKRMSEWENRVRGDQPQWIVVKPTIDDISTGGQKYISLDDGSLLAQGYAPTKHRVKLNWKTELTGITGVRLELLNDPNLPLNGPGRSIWGTCALTEFSVEVSPAGDLKAASRVKIVGATADVNPAEKELASIFDDKSKRRRVEGPIEFAIDDKDETAWGINVGAGRSNQPRNAVFRFEKPLGQAGGMNLAFFLKQNHGGWNSDDNQNNNLGRIRLSVTTTPNPVADPVPAGVRQIIAIPGERRTKAQVDRVFSYWRTTVREWDVENQQIAKVWESYPDGTSQLVLSERGDLRSTFTLKRGDFLRPDKKVMPGVPSFLNPLPAGDPTSRLTFAKWLVDRQSPTTARALINRIWQSYFGTGLYATAEDLGRQGETPSHPELLDWLAVELMDGNSKTKGEGAWSMKRIHRLIVNSATYRQASAVTTVMMERDPFNRLLARGPRLRVEAETVRDIALAASGLLNAKVGGPSVFPPSPEFLYLPPASYGPKTWIEEKGENRYRRAFYTFRFRSVPYPALQTFDAPNGDISCVRRARSNTPLQALTTLNETLFMEAARALAVKTLKEGGVTDVDRLGFAFRRVTGRKPTIAESRELLGMLVRQRTRFASGQLNPWNLATNDPDRPFLLPSGTSMEQLAAWTAVSRVLLNLDETITKE